jgi:hypothetical protein
MPLWRDLVDRVASELARTNGDNANGRRSHDPYVDALEISRRYTHHIRDARPTTFQETVKSVVADAFAHCDPAGSEFIALAKEFASFVKAIGASIIVDLNYDTCCETLLRAADVDVVRRIGSEVHWVGGRPSDVPLLWKIHGSVESPTTIVLSPTEYQRLYEVNALGPQLTSLGCLAQEIWTVGVGLASDDIWAYLCGGTRRVDTRHVAVKAPIVNAILTRPAPGNPRNEPALLAWAGQVEPTMTVNILYGQIPTMEDGTCPSLAVHLNRIHHQLRRQSGKSPRVLGPRARLVDRSREFQRRYLDALNRSNDSAAIAVVDEYRHDFEALREHFLSSDKKGRIGMTWCPWVPAHRADGDHEDVRVCDIADLVRTVGAWVEAFDHKDDAGLLVTCAAQAAVAYALELAELLGIDATMFSLSWPTFLNVGVTARMVGMNPFFVNRENQLRCHLMQPGKLSRGFSMGRPLFKKDPTGPSPTDDLLTEDEWEAAMQLFYENASPELQLRSEKELQTVRFDEIKSIPPLYPWGFLLSDVAAFRRAFDGALSRVWALVADVLPGGNQICKGGSLRDRGRRAFRIGNRGSIRIGERDEFIEAARCFRD